MVKRIELLILGEMHNCPGAPNVARQLILHFKKIGYNVIFANESPTTLSAEEYLKILVKLGEIAQSSVERLTYVKETRYFCKDDQHKLRYMTKENFEFLTDEYNQKTLLPKIAYQFIYYSHNRKAKKELLDMLIKKKIDFHGTDMDNQGEIVHSYEVEKLRIECQTKTLRNIIEQAPDKTVVIHLGGYAHVQRLAANIIYSNEKEPIGDVSLHTQPFFLRSNYVGDDSVKNTLLKNQLLISKDPNIIQELYKSFTIKELRIKENKKGNFILDKFSQDSFNPRTLEMWHTAHQDNLLCDQSQGLLEDAKSESDKETPYFSDEVYYSAGMLVGHTFVNPAIRCGVKVISEKEDSFSECYTNKAGFSLESIFFTTCNFAVSSVINVALNSIGVTLSSSSMPHLFKDTTVSPFVNGLLQAMFIETLMDSTIMAGRLAGSYFYDDAEL